MTATSAVPTSSTSSSFPTITFRSTAVKALRDNTWELDGDLTVRGTTRPVTLQVDFDGADVSPIGDERIGFSAATEINREDFGLTWNMALETGGAAGRQDRPHRARRPSHRPRASGRRLTLPSPRGVDRHARNHR